jgi:hypothetical protein
MPSGQSDGLSTPAQDAIVGLFAHLVGVTGIVNIERGPGRDLIVHLRPVDMGQALNPKDVRVRVGSNGQIEVMG